MIMSSSQYDPHSLTAAAKLLSVSRLAADCAVEAGTRLVSARAPGALCTPIDPNPNLAEGVRQWLRAKSEMVELDNC